MFVVDVKKKQPLILDEFTHEFVFGDDSIDLRLWGFEKYVQSQRFVHPLLAIMERLQWKTDT